MAMQTQSGARRNTPPHLGARSGSPAAGGAPGASLDPVRLLKQYFWWLALVGFVGAVLGVGVHFAILKLHPYYRAEVIFEMTSQITEAKDITTTVGSNEAEIERFIGGQIFIMTSSVLFMQAVADDPAIRNETEWAARFISKDTGLPNYDAMVKEMGDIVHARSVPDSNIVLLRATTQNPEDSATIVSAVKTAYLRQLKSNNQSEASDIQESLSSQLTGTQEERRLLEARMQRLLEDNNVTSLDERLGMQSANLAYLLPTMGEIRRDLEVARDQLKSFEEQLSSPGGATYPELVRSQMKMDPVVQHFQVQIADLEAARRSSLQRLGPNHMLVKEYENNLTSLREQYSRVQEQLLGEMFIQLIEMTRTQVRSLEAAEIEMQSAIDKAERRLTDLKRISEQYGTLQNDQSRLALEESDLNNAIADQRAIVERSASSRVKVSAEATPPDQPIFPDIKVVVPMTIMFTLSLFSGIIVLREVFEQRLRSPSDVRLIPRTRVVGVIPELSEDPSRPVAAELAVRDNPAGVIAEAVRQIRSNILKNFAQQGHKALLVVGGMPGSGAGSLIANLAHSFAAIDHRILVIDANFRRPTMHKYLGVSEGPGLGEVLLGEAQLADTIQSTETSEIDVLSAGKPGCRIYERLTTVSMSRLLDEARARYDLVLVDSPPAIVAGDAIAIANRCDAVLLVVKAYGEKRGLVARIRDQFEETRAEFLGVVLNSVRSSAGGYFKRNFRVTHEYQNGLAEKITTRSKKERIQKQKNKQDEEAKSA